MEARTFRNVWQRFDAYCQWWPWNERRLMLPRVIQDDTFEEVLTGLERLSQASSKPILLVCDSNGGALNPAYKLADAVYHCKAPVVTVVETEAASAAVTVFAAGRLRLMLRGAQLGMHSIRLTSNGYTPDEAVHYAKVVGSQHAIAFSMSFKRKERQDRERLEQLAGRVLPDVLFGKDLLYLNATHAQGFGLCDGTYAEPFTAWWKARKLTPRPQAHAN